MDYYDSSKESVCGWILLLIAKKDWCGHEIADRLSEDVLHFIARYYPFMHTRIKLAILLSILSMKKPALTQIRSYLQKVVDCACNDSDEFVSTIGNIFQPYINGGMSDNEQHNLTDNVDFFFKRFIKQVGRNIRGNVSLHSLEDSVIAPHVMGWTPVYNSTRHFTLTSNPNDLFKASVREAIFDELVKKEEQKQASVHRRSSSTSGSLNNANRPSLQSLARSIPGHFVNEPKFPKSPSEGCVSAKSLPSPPLFAQPYPKSTASTAAMRMTNNVSSRPGFQKGTKTMLMDFNEIAQIDEEAKQEVERALEDYKKKRPLATQSRERYPDNTRYYGRRSSAPWSLNSSASSEKIKKPTKPVKKVRFAE